MTQRHVMITRGLLIAGGTVNLIEYYLYGYVLQVVTGGRGDMFSEPLWDLVMFLTGMIGFGLVLPFIVPKAISIFERSVGWPRWGSSWGAVVGLVKALVFGVIYISVMPFNNMGLWGYGMVSMVFELKYIPAFLLMSVILLGMPLALVEAVVGGASEIVGRRFYSGERKMC